MTRWFALISAMSLAACTGHGGGDDASPPMCDPSTDACSGACATVDSDGDTWSDEVEAVLGTSPTDAEDNPATRDELVFVVPYKETPQPAERAIETPAKLARADIAILLDTTGSMTGTTTRIHNALAEIVSTLSAEVEDIAFGAAGYGDFPFYDGANSDYDVPFYVVHRIMTARSDAGLASIASSFQYKNITDGLGNWWSIMRGGDEPEQHWEALRQVATGIGITYPAPFGTGTRSVPAFDAATAYPAQPPTGEEIGTIGGLGFRENSTPIIIQITDTNAHDGGMTTTNPVSATRAVALAALRAIKARVVGVMAYSNVGHDDLAAMAIDTGGVVDPSAWGTGSERPANCPVGKCCVNADDSVPVVQPDPDPATGKCTLVFKADFYSTNLSKMVIQGVIGVVRGSKFQIGAKLVDDPADDVDTAEAFVERVEALPSGACAGTTVIDTDHDGVPDTFGALVGGSLACFRIKVRPNTTVGAEETTRVFHATFQLTGDGVASFRTRGVTFVVPGKSCGSGPILL